MWSVLGMCPQKFNRTGGGLTLNVGGTTVWAGILEVIRRGEQSWF